MSVPIASGFGSKNPQDEQFAELIPKPILAQVGLEEKAVLTVRDGVIEIHPVRPHGAFNGKY